MTFFQLKGFVVVFLQSVGCHFFLGFSVVFHLHEEFNFSGPVTHSFHTSVSIYRLISSVCVVRCIPAVRTTRVKIKKLKRNSEQFS